MAQVGRLGQREKLPISEAGPGLSEAGMAHLLGLPRLKERVLGDNGRVTGVRLADLAGAGRLQQLFLQGIPIRRPRATRLMGGRGEFARAGPGSVLAGRVGA